jgi:hypothetical protein
MADGKWKMEKTWTFCHLPFAILHQAGFFQRAANVSTPCPHDSGPFVVVAPT